MAGLVPAIHILHHSCMSGGYVYILASAPNGILYVGLRTTSFEESTNIGTGSSQDLQKKYSIKRLVYFEHYEEIQAAIQREHNIRDWSRKWKVRLILANNPDWNDLYDSIT